MTAPGPGSAGVAPGRVAEIERAFAGKLQDRRTVARLDPATAEAARAWSDAVWACAEAAGPLAPSSEEVERGLALARRPVFVCGVHRSGTTLLRDLLDGHPALLTLPSESEFHTRYEPMLARLLPDHHAGFLGRRWLERIANPNNQPPYWLLGRSEDGLSPYVAFARAFRGWCAALENEARLGVASWPLVAFALTYAGQTAAAPGVTMWVDKTPTNERHLARLWREFPEARVLHVVRRPDAVLASHKALLERAGRPARGLAATLRDLARSYRIAAERSANAPPGRYLLVRYEDLVARPSEALGQIARFLGIEPAASLLKPTVAGRPATNNSAFVDGRRAPAQVLTAFERDLLALAVGRRAARLGYRGIEPGSAVGRALGRVAGRQRSALTTTT